MGKKPLAFSLFLVLSIAMFGCVSQPQITKETESSQTPIQTPARSLAAETDADTSTAPVSADGVSRYYPSDRIPLPTGSEVLEVKTDFSEEFYEDTKIKLPMTKTEAIGYFKPLLEKNADYFEQGDSALVALEIRGAYPDVKGVTELYARYAKETANTSIIRISLYTLEDSETLGLAVVSVKYHSKP